MRGYTYTMADTKVHLGFQSTPSFFPNKNDDFNYIIKIVIKKIGIISQSFPYAQCSQPPR